MIGHSLTSCGDPRRPSLRNIFQLLRTQKQEKPKHNSNDAWPYLTMLNKPYTASPQYSKNDEDVRVTFALAR